MALQAALDERWIAAATFLDEAFPEDSADRAKLAGAVAEPPGPGPGARGRARRRGPRRPRRLRGGPAGRRHRRDTAAPASQGGGRPPSPRDHAVLGRRDDGPSPADDGEETVHPHTYNGYLAVVAHKPQAG